MGTASTMQVLSEALGLALPGTSLLPATSEDLLKMAQKAGECAVSLAHTKLTPKKILTVEAFENAIMVHAAIAGSSNSLLHIPAIAHELDIELDGDFFDCIHRNIPYILNIRPSGFYPAGILYICRWYTCNNGRITIFPSFGCPYYNREKCRRKFGRTEAK